MYLARDPHPTYHRPRMGCSHCALAPHCLPATLNPVQLLRLEQLVTSVTRLSKGDVLYRTGRRFAALYIPRTGFLKCSALLEDGREQVLSFGMPGDLLGTDGIGSDTYRSDAVALEDATVCVVPFPELEALGRELPQVQRSLHRLMSREIAREHQAIALLAGLPARARLAAFLLAWSERFAARGYSAAEFRLPMRREEIGSYLGLKHETVSRGLTNLARRDLITVRGRQVRILAPAALRELAGSADACPTPAIRARIARPVRPSAERRVS